MCPQWSCCMFFKIILKHKKEELRGFTIKISKKNIVIDVSHYVNHAVHTHTNTHISILHLHPPFSHLCELFHFVGGFLAHEGTAAGRDSHCRGLLQVSSWSPRSQSGLFFKSSIFSQFLLSFKCSSSISQLCHTPVVKQTESCSVCRFDWRFSFPEKVIPWRPFVSPGASTQDSSGCSDSSMLCSTHEQNEYSQSVVNEVERCNVISFIGFILQIYSRTCVFFSAAI